MAEHIQASYKASLGDAEDGELVLIEAGDGSIKVGIKGTQNGNSCATILAGLDPLPCPFISFEPTDCLALGKNFVVAYDPTIAEFRRDGKWDLGLLMVDGGGTFICAHSKQQGSLLVNVEDGSLNQPRSAAAFARWSLGLRQLDGTIQTLYQRQPS